MIHFCGNWLIWFSDFLHLFFRCPLPFTSSLQRSKFKLNYRIKQVFTWGMRCKFFGSVFDVDKKMRWEVPKFEKYFLVFWVLVFLCKISFCFKFMGLIFLLLIFYVCFMFGCLLFLFCQAIHADILQRAAPILPGGGLPSCRLPLGNLTQWTDRDQCMLFDIVGLSWSVHF